MPRGKRNIKKALEEVKETEEEVVVSSEEVEKAPKKKVYKDMDEIKCHSIIAGGLTITCKSGNYYYFNNYGAEIFITYRDLTELIRTHSSHIFAPRIVIDDPNVVAQFSQLKKFYEESYSIKDLKKIINLPQSQMENTINNLPDGVKDNLRSIAAEMINTGELDSISRIRTLDKIYNTDMTFLSSLKEG